MHNVWYRDSDGENKIGKCLGPAAGIGGGDCFWILTMSARPIARSTVWEIATDELTTEAVKESIKSLDLSINEKIGDDRDDAVAAANLGGPLPANGDYLDDDEDD
jgi:hypothetical protein